jgi:NAD(P)-dependent dehydrogenase (short-subunit alcohol dehydrogenase family)
MDAPEGAERRPAARNVLVTGGSRGIGRAVVERFSRAGDRVWLTYHSARREARAVASGLTGAGARAEAFEFSQGNWPSHLSLLRSLPGSVDVLVNNAAVGTGSVERYVQGSAQERDAAFLQVNSVGPLWLIQQVLPGMIDRGYGKIINIASVGGGVAAFPGFGIADGMSKAAVAYLTRHLAADLTHQPVDVFAVCPGAVDTDMFRSSTLAGLTTSQQDALTSRLPQGRLIQPEEIAEIVWWLSTGPACTVAGAVIDASMGLGAHPGLMTGPAAASSSGGHAQLQGWLRRRCDLRVRSGRQGGGLRAET